MAGRPKRPIILRKENAIKHFDSIADAARWLGVNPPSVISVLKNQHRHYTIYGFTAEYENPVPPEIKGFIPKSARKERKEKESEGHYKDMVVEIDGIKYKSVPVENKINCKGCDILKQSYQYYQPFCFDYAYGKHKIVELCRGHQMIWKRQ